MVRLKKALTALIIAGVMAFGGLASALAAEGPTLEPAEYKPLPGGTEIKYDNRFFSVSRSEGFTTVFQTFTGGKEIWLTTHALFGETADNLHGTHPRGDDVTFSIDDENQKKLEGLWPLKVGKKISYTLNQEEVFWMEADTWEITLEVSKTEILELNGLGYPTYVIEEEGRSNTGKVYVGQKWYQPDSGLVIKAERTWRKSFATGNGYYPTAPRFDQGEADNYALRKVTFPKGTTNLALKGTKIPTGGEADKALTAEVERLRRALAAKGQAGTGAAAPFSALPAPDDIDFGRFHALVIGINDYEYLPKLQTAVDDAKAIANVLITDYGYRVRLLINPDYGGIIDALDEYRETLSDGDNLLIYYAGHGWLDEESDRGYWLPVDAKPKRRRNWVSNATITDTLKALSAKQVMVVADSCYSGTLTRAVDMSSRRRTGDYWRKMSEKWARVAITSGGLEPVADKGGGKHSPFAKAFLDALKDNNAIMDGTQLFSKMRRPVMLATQQTPQYSDVRNAGHDGGDFIFMRTK